MNKGISNIIGVIIVAVILICGIGGYMYFKNKQVGPVSTTYKLRDVGPAGGIIFYDKGSYSNGWRYLEATLKDQSEVATWGCFGTSISGADETAIGTGHQNTHDMIAAGCTNAAQLTHGVTINGYSDWFLPSKDELAQLYVNRAAIGGFTTHGYWSSSESNASFAWLQDFYYGYQLNVGKSYAYYVRAVRAF